MANLFQKIECFLGLHKMETKIDKRKFSTVHYNECKFCGTIELFDDAQCDCLPTLKTGTESNER